MIHVRLNASVKFATVIAIAAMLIVSAQAIAQAKIPPAYSDGRAVATMRMDARDRGIVLEHGDSFDRLGARDVTAWKDGKTFYMHYDAAGPTGWLTALADSADGEHWTKRGTVLALGGPNDDDSKTASSAYVFHADDVWHLFYIGTRNSTPPPDRIPAVPYVTMHATAHSPRGPWTKDPHDIPFRPIAGTFYSDTASAGQVIRDGEDNLMFFSAAREEKGKYYRTLGIARTRDLNGTWKVDPQPIFPASEQVENSSIYYEPANQNYFLFVDHVGIGALGDEFTDAIWVYWSKTLTSWNVADKAIVLDGSNCRWSGRIMGMPATVPDGDRLLIYYDGAKGGSTSHMGRDIGLATLALPLRTPK